MAVLVNTTFFIRTTESNRFMEWMECHALPIAKATNSEHEPLITRLLDNPGEDIVGYAMQMQFQSLSEARQWHASHGDVLLARIHDIFADKALYFTTFMDIIHQ